MARPFQGSGLERATGGQQLGTVSNTALSRTCIREPRTQLR
jgi:hypothetical protein